MATEKSATQAATPPVDWRGRTTLLGYLRDVAIAAVILGAGLYLYYQHEQTGRKIRALGKEAKEYMLKDSVKAYTEAEKRLLEMVSLDSSYPFALASLGELYTTRWMDMGIDADAANAKKYTDLASKTDAKINERFGAEIYLMLAEKRYEDAAKFASDITKKAASSHVVNGYGRALRGLGRIDEARQALKKSADTEWRNPRFACDFADVFFEDGDFVNAQAFYAKGIEASSEHVRSLIGRSRAQLSRGQKIKEAYDTLTTILKEKDQLPPKIRAQALTGMSEMRGLEQKFDEALALADEAIAAYPSYAWGHFAKARILAVQKKPAEAAAEFDKTLELDKYVPEFYYNGSNAMMDAGDPAKAQALLDSYLKSLKEDDRFHLAYGNLLMKVEKPEDALKHFDKAIELNNFNAVAHYAKGAALFDARKTFLTDPKDKKKRDELFESAKKELDLALEVQEYFPGAHTKLGDILFEKEEWGDGCQEYAQALMQMKTLQAPRERMTELRDRINDRLIKDAKKRDVAKAWMDETGKLIR